MSNKIEIKYENDCYSVIAREDIETGELLMIEEIFHGNVLNLLEEVKNNSKLRKSLFPRDKEFINQNKNDPEIINTHGYDIDVLLKVKYNKWGGSNCTLGDKISKFNHSCKNNIQHSPIGLIPDKEKLIESIFSLRRIKKSEELFLNYIYPHSYDHNIKKYSFLQSCNCSSKEISDEYMKKVLKIQCRLLISFMKKNTTLITEYIQKYCDKKNNNVELINFAKINDSIFDNL